MNILKRPSSPSDPKNRNPNYFLPKNKRRKAAMNRKLKRQNSSTKIKARRRGTNPKSWTILGLDNGVTITKNQKINPYLPVLAIGIKKRSPLSKDLTMTIQKTNPNHRQNRLQGRRDRGHLKNIVKTAINLADRADINRKWRKKYTKEIHKDKKIHKEVDKRIDKEIDKGIDQKRDKNIDKKIKTKEIGPGKDLTKNKSICKGKKILPDKKKEIAIDKEKGNATDKFKDKDTDKNRNKDNGNAKDNNNDKSVTKGKKIRGDKKDRINSDKNKDTKKKSGDKGWDRSRNKKWTGVENEIRKIMSMSKTIL